VKEGKKWINFMDDKFSISSYLSIYTNSFAYLKAIATLPISFLLPYSYPFVKISGLTYPNKVIKHSVYYTDLHRIA